MRLNDEGVPMAVQSVEVTMRPSNQQTLARLHLCDGKRFECPVERLCMLSGLPTMLLAQSLDEFQHEICYTLEEFAVDHWHEMHSKSVRGVDKQQ